MRIKCTNGILKLYEIILMHSLTQAFLFVRFHDQVPDIESFSPEPCNNGNSYTICLLPWNRTDMIQYAKYMNCKQWWSNLVSASLPYPLWVPSPPCPSPSRSSRTGSSVYSSSAHQWFQVQNPLHLNIGLNFNPLHLVIRLNFNTLIHNIGLNFKPFHLKIGLNFNPLHLNIGLNFNPLHLNTGLNFNPLKLYIGLNFNPFHLNIVLNFNPLNLNIGLHFHPLNLKIGSNFNPVHLNKHRIKY